MLIKAEDILREARIYLRTKLFQVFSGPIDNTLKCPCSTDCHLNWCTAFTSVNIWPCADIPQKSVHDIIHQLGILKFSCYVPDTACANCKANFSTTKAHERRENLQSRFHGLCLDCMARSKKPDRNSVYFWNDIDQDWGSTCRAKHGQATWFFSFLGKEQYMKDHLDLIKEIGELEVE